MGILGKLEKNSIIFLEFFKIVLKYAAEIRA